MTTTDLTQRLTTELAHTQPSLRHAQTTAEHLTPFIETLLADARTDGFRQGFQAGRTLNRERRMS